MAVILNPCVISRRGKAAKGTVRVHTIGKPINNSDGITKDWDYDDLIGKYSQDELLAKIAEVSNVNLALMMQYDALAKSETMKSSNQVSLLSAEIYSQKLAVSKANATTLAKGMIQYRSLCEANDDDVPSIETLMEKRSKAVDKLKAQDLWFPEAEESKESE